MNENNIEQDSLKAWLLAARPKTLTGAAVPVLIGLALAWVDTRSFTTDVFSWTAALLCMAFALLMQIDANFINDFFDYARGNDDAERRLGPLRACTQGWVKIESMKRDHLCRVLLPLHHPPILYRYGRRTGGSVLWHRTRLDYLLYTVAHLYMAGVCGILSLWHRHRLSVNHQQLS